MSENSANRTAPKWEVDTRDRLKAMLRRFSKPLADLVARDANEGDTRLLVTDVLCEALGYDKYTDLSTEYAVKGEFADYGLRIDQQLVAFVEVKRAATKLGQKHLRQVEMYAVNEGIEWLILTNGAQWEVYRLIPGMPVTIDLVLSVDLLSEAKLSAKVDELFYITQESLKRGQIEEKWKAAASTAPESLTEVMLSDAVLTEAARELRRRTGHRVPPGDLGRLVRNSVVRPELTR